MAKRHGDSTNGVGLRLKKRRGIKVRTIYVPDSDDEDPPPKIGADYARLLKTRVTTSGKADNVTMKTLPLFEDKEIAHDSSEPTIDSPEDVRVENTLPARTAPAKRQRKKANDSVRRTYSP